MIISVIKEVYSLWTVWFQSFPDLLFCFFRTVHIGSADIAHIDSFQILRPFFDSFRINM